MTRLRDMPLYTRPRHIIMVQRFGGPVDLTETCVAQTPIAAAIRWRIVVTRHLLAGYTTSRLAGIVAVLSHPDGPVSIVGYSNMDELRRN